MKIVRTIIGATIAGLLAGSVWGEFVNSYGILGGWLAGLVIIGIMWFMNHYIGLIHNHGENSFVDMGLAIGTTFIVKDAIMLGGHELAGSLPTLALVLVGGGIGGALACMSQKSMEKEKENATNE